MKPPKPRITKPRLCWKWKGRLWEPYHRITWTDAGKVKQKTVRLDWQGNAQELDRLYWECETGRHKRQQKPSKYTWGALIDAWRSDPRVQSKLSDGTKSFYRLPMDHINEKNGGKDVRVTTRAAIRAAHDSMADKPRQADKHIQTIRMLWNYAKNKLDWPLGDNPAANIDLFGKQKEFEPWPAWMIEKLDSAPDRVRVAAELILGTGQRPSAAIMMTWSQFNGEWMDVTDAKGDETYTVYCPKPLRDFLAGVRKEGRFVLAKNLTEQVTYDGVASAFQKWRKTLGPEAKKYTLHGLRKLAIVRLAEAGCTDAQIQAVTNQSAEMVAYYRKRASRKILSEEAYKK